jgi:hypothetical protein
MGDWGKLRDELINRNRFQVLLRHSRHCTGEKCVKIFCWKTGRMILEWILCVDCIVLAQDGDHWQRVVNTVMNLRAPYKMGSF